MESKFYKWIDIKKTEFVPREGVPPEIIKEYEE